MTEQSKAVPNLDGVDPQVIQLAQFGSLMQQMLSAVYTGLVKDDKSDVYTSLSLDGRAMGVPSDLILFFALAGPSYSPDKLGTLGCPFCHRPPEAANVEASTEPPEPKLIVPEPRRKKRAPAPGGASS